MCRELANLCPSSFLALRNFKSKRMRWCGRVVKMQCCEPCEVFCEPHRRNHFTTSQQSIQLSILPRSVNEYSEVTLRAQALDTH